MSTLPYYDTAFCIPGRVLVSAATFDGDDMLPGADLCWFSAEVSHWQIRSAHMAIVSDRGGIPLHLASRASDKYDGRPVWACGVTVAAGDEYGFAHSIYEALNAGVTGATQPTHLSGDVSDGAITWRFKDRINRTPISLSLTFVQDIWDGLAGWPMHFESIQKPGAGSIFGEWAVKAGQSVANDPYNIGPAKSAIGLRWVAGGDPTYAPSDFNVTSAFTFEKGAGPAKWLGCLVFAQDAIATDATGAMRPVKFAKGHRQTWYTGAGLVGFDLWSDVSANNERVALGAYNRTVNLFCQGAAMASFESAAPAGTPPAHQVALIAQGPGVGFAEVRARSATEADSDLKFVPKGAGRVRFGTVQPITAPMAVTGYIEIKDASGVIRKLAVIE